MITETSRGWLNKRRFGSTKCRKLYTYHIYRKYSGRISRYVLTKIIIHRSMFWSALSAKLLEKQTFSDQFKICFILKTEAGQDVVVPKVNGYTFSGG